MLGRLFFTTDIFLRFLKLGGASPATDSDRRNSKLIAPFDERGGERRQKPRTALGATAKAFDEMTLARWNAKVERVFGRAARNQIMLGLAAALPA